MAEGLAVELWLHIGSMGLAVELWLYKEGDLDVITEAGKEKRCAPDELMRRFGGRTLAAFRRSYMHHRRAVATALGTLR